MMIPEEPPGNRILVVHLGSFPQAPKSRPPSLANENWSSLAMLRMRMRRRKFLLMLREYPSNHEQKRPDLCPSVEAALHP
jgi:hypothetical protein